MILLDTCVLIDALTGPRRSALALHDAVERGERMLLSTIVLYEWLRGPRSEDELRVQEALFPADIAVPFGPDEATRAAELYRRLRAQRGREIDLAIAASALCSDATLWTLNVKDFRDVPGLDVTRPGRN